MRLPGKSGRTLNGEDMASKRTRKMNNPSAESPDLPLYLFHQGTNYRAYKYFGAHFDRKEGCVVFRVWAPHADAVSLVGDFNDWAVGKNPLHKTEDGETWEISVKGLRKYDNYKYAVTYGKKTVLKADPYAYHAETAPATASKLYDIEKLASKAVWYEEQRKNYTPYASPVNIYEVNLASWKRKEDGSYLSYKELERELVPYVKRMNYTHVEFMPVSEYPYDGSWGYQVTGYFGVTSRFGTPEDFKSLIDAFHNSGIGVILDWVPAHFPKDEHGLYEFDGTCLYEYADEFKKEHKSWGTRVFDFGKKEVRSFLISSALFYFDVYGIDGIRVDAVASMLYLDYDRKKGEWKPNEKGTNINLEAVEFLQQLNSAVFAQYPYALMIAEESTAFPMVTMPASIGGLGFNFKWNMGWMNDVLSYVSTDPLFRGGCHNKLTFSMMYAFSENFILPVSHDEVVYGKRSLFNKMPGDEKMQHAGVRAFMGYMMAHPGKKLMFMGQEFDQYNEWNFAKGLEFELLKRKENALANRFFRELNAFYRDNDELWSIEKSWDGFEWTIADDSTNNVLAFVRKGVSGKELLCIINFSGLTLRDYRVGVDGRQYVVKFSSDSKFYGGDGTFRKKEFVANRKPMHGKKKSIKVNLVPLSFMYLERV